MSTPVRNETALRIDAQNGRYEGRLEATLHLDEPRTRLLLRVPTGTVGRAEAKLDRRNWAAAHYWTEESAEGPVVTIEFSEALPAGDVRLVVPFSGALTPAIAALSSGSSPESAQAVLPHFDGAGEWRLQVTGADAGTGAHV